MLRSMLKLATLTPYIAAAAAQLLLQRQEVSLARPLVSCVHTLGSSEEASHAGSFQHQQRGYSDRPHQQARRPVYLDPHRHPLSEASARSRPHKVSRSHRHRIKRPFMRTRQPPSDRKRQGWRRRYSGCMRTTRRTRLIRSTLLSRRTICPARFATSRPSCMTRCPLNTGAAPRARCPYPSRVTSASRLGTWR